MAKYKAYPEYKDSGVELLGEVPLTWRVFKLKFGLSEPLVYGANEAALDDNPDNPRYIRITDMNPDGTLRNDTFKSLPKVISEPYMLIDGDILLARSGATVGKSFYYKSIFGPSCFAGYLIRARFNGDKIIPRLAYWFFQSSIYWQYVNGSQIQATIQNVSAEKYSDLYLSAPLEYAEQALVADFLDHETAKIDNLIEKQQQLIELLKEKRQAVISHAVTKGLNPDVPMKDSGVEWLGEVPEHWIVSGFKKYLSSIVDYRGKTPNKTDGGILLVTARNIKKGVLDYTLSQEFIAPSDYKEVMSRGLPDIGDVLFTTEAPLGEVANVDRVDIALAQRIIKFKGMTSHLDNYYFKYFIMSSAFQQSLNLYSSGSTAQGIKAERFVYLRKLLPSINEQMEIVGFLDKEITKIDILVEQQFVMLSLLQERRTALISAAVTGKIDVRDWVAPETSGIEVSQEATA